MHPEASMIIYDVKSEEFSVFGRIIDGMDTEALLDTLEKVSPCPEDGTVYVPDVPELDSLPVHKFLSEHVYGGLPVQIGYCSGTNYKLNCLEYHKGSEINISPDEIFLLLADLRDVRDGRIDTSRVKAFRIPPRTAVLLYETTLHYAPCGKFRTIIVLPYGTNGKKPAIKEETAEDKYLWGANKWLIAHPDTAEAEAGAFAGLTGENIDISAFV